MAPGWRHTRSVYGPGFTLLSAAVVGLTRSSSLAARVAFQAISAGALVFCGVVLARAHAPRWTLAAVLLNPLVLVSAVNGGHNDTLVGAALLAATLALARHRPVAGGVALAAAMNVKLVAVLPAVAAGAWVWRHHGRRAAALAAAAATAPVVAGYLAFGGPRALSPLIDGAHQMSLPELVGAMDWNRPYSFRRRPCHHASTWAGSSFEGVRLQPYRSGQKNSRL